jgi:hypothetical protein
VVEKDVQAIGDLGGIEKALKLLVLVAVKDMKLKEQVALMSKAGFDRNEMARLLESTPNSISVRLAELKSKEKGSETGSSAKTKRGAPRSA